ncbi:UMP kinase [Mycoplasmatota bacterium]|nr:UMP kinase [Mycoplasmatota bacterium]
MSKYKRIILKLSGEALAGKQNQGIDPITVRKFAEEIKKVHDEGFEIGIIVGGGNIWRGRQAEAIGMDRASADYMGMLGTVINALALSNTLIQIGVDSRPMTSMAIPSVAEPYLRNKALSHLRKGKVLVFGGGTGNPFFSTDTTASLRAAEMNADVILMAKNGVDAVYDSDPKTNPNAKRINEITYVELINQKLEVIDLTAAAMCSDNNIDTILFDMNVEDNIKRAAFGENIGTKITC